MKTNPLKDVMEKNRSGQRVGLYSVCSANELVLRGAIRHAVNHNYPLIIESTSNQVNQLGGYTGIRPHEFTAFIQKIACEENMDAENLILGGDHLGPLIWQNENEDKAMIKAAEMIKAYTLAGYTKIHLDTSMKLSDDPPGPLSLAICARRGAYLAKTVYETFATMPGNSKRPLLVIGSEVPIPGGQRTEGQSDQEKTVIPTKAEDFQLQVSIFKDEFAKAGVDFKDVIAFVVQPGVEFGDDFVCLYDPGKAAALTGALKEVHDIVFEGHSTDYQSPGHLAALVKDGVAILKVGPAFTFYLRETLFLLEEIEKIIVPEGNLASSSPKVSKARRRVPEGNLASSSPKVSKARRRVPEKLCSNFKNILLGEMNANKKYWEKYYSGSTWEIEYKKFYSYSDRCRYYLPSEPVQKSMELLLKNITAIPPALLSQFFPAQYRRYITGTLNNDPLSIIYNRIGDLCSDYAAACGFIKEIP